MDRFLQPDPLSYADGLNLYAYVGNDPLNLTDPSGLLGKRLYNAYSLNKTAVDFALGLTPLGGLGEACYLYLSM